jgi:DNA repair exonuclease SbcCD ATPase subunit
VAGLVVAIVAAARHRRARRRAGLLRVAIDWLNREIGARTAERTLLGSRPAPALLGSAELERCPDPGVREHAERIARVLPTLVAGGDLEQTIEQSDAEVRSAEGELAAIRQRESALQVALAQAAARRTLAPAAGDLAGSFPRLLRHLSAFHGLPGLAAQRSQALAELLAVDEIGSGLPAPRILSALAGVREALPAPATLATEVERMAAEQARRIGERSRLQEQAAGVRAELSERAAEFAAVRAAQAVSDRLTARRSELDRDLSRETLARQLLDETAERLRRRVAPRLATALEGALGDLTGGRYSRVEVPEDLTIHLHSEEKQALISAEELSAGTRMQLELALRLACMELFLELKAPQGTHFMFLDEPIEGLDPERAQSFVQLLRQYAERCGQVFLAGKEPALAKSGAPVIRLGEAGTGVRRLRTERVEEDVPVAMPVEA